MAKSKSTSSKAKKRLDKALSSDMYDDNALAEKTVADMLLKMAETVETGRKIGKAAVESPVFGIAIAVSVLHTLLSRSK